MVKGGGNYLLTAFMVHALREDSIGADVGLVGDELGDLGERAAGVVGFGDYEGVGEIIFLIFYLGTVVVGEGDVDIFFENAGAVESHSF